MLVELALDVGQGELSGVDGDFELGEDPGQAADVVPSWPWVSTMARTPGLVFNQVGDIRDYDIDAEQLRLGEHEAGVDHDDVIFVAKGEAVHAEFAKAAERDDFQFFRLHLSALMVALHASYGPVRGRQV